MKIDVGDENVDLSETIDARMGA